MSSIHVLKQTNKEVILKCYKNVAEGGSIDIVRSDSKVALPGETYDSLKCKLTIRAIYWGTKPNKQLDITRIVPTTPQYVGDTEYDASGIHSHYFLMNSGSYQFQGFVDSAYGAHDIRITGDGPFHCILVLGKEGWVGTTNL